MERNNSPDASLQSLSSLLDSLVGECDRRAKTLEEIGNLEQKRQAVRTQHEEKIRSFREDHWKGLSRNLFPRKYLLPIEREIGTLQSECTSREQNIFAMIASLRCELDTFWTLHPNAKEVCNEICQAIVNLDFQSPSSCLHSRQYLLNFRERLLQAGERNTAAVAESLNSSSFEILSSRRPERKTSSASSPEADSGKVFSPSDFGGKELCIVVSYWKDEQSDLQRLAQILTNKARVRAPKQYQRIYDWYKKNPHSFSNHLYKLRKKAEKKGFWEQIPPKYWRSYTT